MATPKKAQPTYIREIELRYKKRRVKSEAPVHEPLTDPKKVYDLFSDLQNEAKEKLITISLDTKLKMLCFEVVAVGSIDTVHSRPFEAIRTSIATNAHGIIMVHNHPSGDPTPSESDRAFTHDLMELLVIGGSSFHDHIIIGGGQYFSFAERGLLKEIRDKVVADRRSRV